MLSIWLRTMDISKSCGGFTTTEYKDGQPERWIGRCKEGTSTSSSGCMNRSEGCSVLATCEAARLGHLNVLRWLLEHYPGRDNLMEFAAWEGHLEVVQYLDQNTNQCASRWGVATAAKRGWLQAQLVLLEHHHEWDNLEVVGRAFDETLAQLSCQHAASDSALWTETVETLERFHSKRLYSCVSLMLERALRRGYLRLAQRFVRYRNASERCKYVQVAAQHRNIVLLRWMLANGTPIDTSAAIGVGEDRSSFAYVEVAGYLSESDRVQLVCEATRKTKLRKLLQWTLENTNFSGGGSRDAIRKAIREASTDTVQWLRENVTETAAGLVRLSSHE
jgi:hypothetical protein